MLVEVRYYGCEISISSDEVSCLYLSSRWVLQDLSMTNS